MGARIKGFDEDPTVWQPYQNDMSLGHLFDPIFDNHYIICNIGLIASGGCYVTKLCNYVSDIFHSDINTQCPTSIDLTTL